MTTVVLGAPSAPLPDPSGHPGWEYMQVRWIGPNGTEFDLTHPDGGVFLTRAGVRGLGVTPRTHYRDRSPAIAGAMWRGLSYDPREAYWPVHLFHDGSTREWVEFDGAFWRSLLSEGEGRWIIRVPGVSERQLRLRFEDDGDWAPEADPTFYGWATYGITLQADQPFWESVEPVVGGPWIAGAPVDFFGGTTPGDPIIRISSGRSFTTATVTNPGDVEAYGVWTFTGPFTSTSATIGGHQIELPFALAAGKSIDVDTSPTELTAIDSDGVDRFPELGVFDPAPIPPGVDIPVTVTMAGTTGASSVSVKFTPLWHKAWG